MVPWARCSAHAPRPGNPIESWHDFFVAEVGGAAALAGLLFVAISINIQEILKFAHLPLRAAHTLLLLLSALIISSVGLIPLEAANDGLLLGWVALLFWVTSAGMLTRYASVAVRWVPDGTMTRTQSMNYLITFISTAQLATLPSAIGGILLLTGASTGLYWIAAGILLTFASAVYNTWILLVEILR